MRSILSLFILFFVTLLFQSCAVNQPKREEVKMEYFSGMSNEEMDNLLNAHMKMSMSGSSTGEAVYKTDSEFFAEQSKSFYFCTNQDREKLQKTTESFLCLRNQTAKLYQLKQIDSKMPYQEWCWDELNADPADINCVKLKKNPSPSTTVSRMNRSDMTKIFNEEEALVFIYYKNDNALERGLQCLKKNRIRCPLIDFQLHLEASGGKIMQTSSCMAKAAKEWKCY